MLRNLIMNAIKFTFTGGEITIKATEQESQLTLSVSDTGQGISSRNLAKIFTDQRFTTLGTTQEKGTGLGLMLCKEMVESLHGRISVTSEEKIGSVFTITLPNVMLTPVPAAV